MSLFLFNLRAAIPVRYGHAMCARCPCTSTTCSIYTPFSSQVSLFEHHLQHPLLFIPTLARVSWFAGAGVECCWRKCGICLGTCAAKRASARSNDAGPNPFFTLAPTTMHTCGNDYLHLLQQHYTPTPPIRAPGFLKFKCTLIWLSLH